MHNKNDIDVMAGCLTETSLLKKAGENIYRRGRTYWKQGKVVSFQETSEGIAAQVQGDEVYQISLWANKKKLRGECSCPAAKGGRFCKHAVAAGLVWLVHKGHEISDEPVCPFNVGDRVIYARNGLGTVVSIETVDDAIWVVVNFDTGESQRLAIAYAVLRLATEEDEEAGREKMRLMAKFWEDLGMIDVRKKKTPTLKIKPLRVYTQQKSDADNALLGAATCGLVGPFAFPFEYAFERNRGGRKSSRKSMHRSLGIKGVPLYIEAVSPPFKTLRYLLRELGERVSSHQFQTDEDFFSLFGRFPVACDDANEVILDLTHALEEQSCPRYGTRKFINEQRSRFYKKLAELQHRAIANGRYFPVPNILRACIHRTYRVRMEMGFTKGFVPDNQLYVITFPAIEARIFNCDAAGTEGKNAGVELILDEKSIDEQKQQSLTIKFGDCDAGWILMRLSNGECSLVVTLSHFLDPLPNMLAWLESIVIGVQRCGFRVDEEGRFTDLSAERELHPKEGWRSYTNLDVVQEHAPLALRVTLPTLELVGGFYRSFREFAESPEYVRKNWERITLENVVNEQLGMTAAGWIDSVISLEPRELQKAFWKIDPCIERCPPSYMDDIGTEAELLELTGQTTAEAGGLPHYCVLPKELWGHYAKKDVQAQREYLEGCLSDPVQTSWDGWPWNKMRSALIEDWLASEGAKFLVHGEKWLT